MKTLLLCLTLFTAFGIAGTESYTYDPAGRLIAVDYGAVVIRYTYDKNGNLLSQTAERLASRRAEAEKSKEQAAAKPENKRARDRR
jgi:YD repeat-containing protein